MAVPARRPLRLLLAAGCAGKIVPAAVAGRCVVAGTSLQTHVASPAIGPDAASPASPHAGRRAPKAAAIGHLPDGRHVRELGGRRHARRRAVAGPRGPPRVRPGAGAARGLRGRARPGRRPARRGKSTLLLAMVESLRAAAAAGEPRAPGLGRSATAGRRWPPPGSTGGGRRRRTCPRCWPPAGSTAARWCWSSTTPNASTTPTRRSPACWPGPPTLLRHRRGALGRPARPVQPLDQDRPQVPLRRAAAARRRLRRRAAGRRCRGGRRWPSPPGADTVSVGGQVALIQSMSADG